MNKNRTPTNQSRKVRAAGREITLIGTFCILVLLACVAVTAKFTTSWFSQASPEAEKQTDKSESERMGTIVLPQDEDRCERMKFDNDTGHVQKSGSCDAVVLDTRGNPVPMGTVRRLESISNSFFGKTH